MSLDSTGIKVKCSRCTQVFFMYTDTHPSKDWDKVGGMCPRCNNWCTAKIRTQDWERFNVDLYPPLVNGSPAPTVLPYYAGEEAS
jgi:hypothetical protein